MCITPLSLQSLFESQETQPLGTPPSYISQHLQASQEVQSSGRQDLLSTFQIISNSQDNKLAGNLTSLQISDNVKYVQQVTESIYEPSSWQPGSDHSRKTRNKKQKKKGEQLVFSSFNSERKNTVCLTFFVLKGNDGVRTGEFNVFDVQESLDEALHPRTPVSELKDLSLQ